MKLKNTLLTIISCALLATGAHAVIYTDLDVYNRLVNATNPLTGYFQISSQDNDGINDIVGYDSKTEQITSAIASFYLLDDSWTDGWETVTITLGLASSTFVDSQAATILWAVGGVTGSALFDLGEDGILKYKIVANTGDFKAHKGFLAACAQPKAVPDGGATATLLGMGFLGICAVQRKFASAR